MAQALAVPLNVAPAPKENITFNPPLENERLESLSKIKMGSYKKIQLEFCKDDIFWNDIVIEINFFIPS